MSDPLKDADTAASKAESILVTYWGKEVDLSLKREKRFRRQAGKVVKLYEVDKPQENSFNVLYSNTETLLPSIYNSSPRPVVERRFHDEDPLAKHAGQVAERTLSYLLDPNSDEYEQYHSLIRQAVLMALVPGRGVTWWKYDPRMAEKPPGKAEDGNPDQRIAGEVLPAKGKVLWETICGEDINYDDFLMGYARRWVDVPWVARRHCMTKDDAKHNFGEDIANKLAYIKSARRDAEGMGSKKQEEEVEGDNEGSAETCEVYEIWNKAKREVLFFAPTFRDDLLKVVSDPLGLSGFFPCYRPLHFLKKTTTLIPTPVYMAYESQAIELNRISLRITRVTNAIKVRGFYDGTVQGLEELLNKDDNTLIKAKNVVALEGKKLSDSIWLMPLGDLITVLNELFAAQNNCKNTIYEITGIADIMRGDTQASETYGAQKIKDKWGTLRLQNMQGAVQNYVRGCLRIVAELAGKHFGIETFAAMTNLDYATPEQVQQAQQMQQAVQQQLLVMQQQQAQAAAMQPPAAPGGPPSGAPVAQPPAPQIPPQLQQVMQQTQATLAKPKWEEVVGLLRNNLQRQYRIDIETNSTLADTTAEEKANVADALTAISNTMESFAEPLQQGVFPLPAFKAILLKVARTYEFGRRVEDELNAIPDQMPPKQDPEAEKAAQQLQKDQQDLEKQKMALQQKTSADQLAISERAAEMQRQQAEADTDLRAREDALVAKQAEISAQIQQGLKDTAAAVKEAAAAAKAAKDEQEMSQKKFLLDMELRLAKSEMANEKRNNQTQNKIAADKQERKAEQAAEKAERAAEKKTNGAHA